MGKNAIHQLTSQSTSQMMSYVIETADGKIIVIDGGRSADAEYLLNFVRSLTGGEVKIDAWFLTHVHSDHIDAFTEAVNHHSDSLTLGRLYYNFPPAELCGKYEKAELHTSLEFNEVLPLIGDKAAVVNTGDKIKVGEAEFEILFTPMNTITMNFINNTSLVFRMTLAGQTVLFTGDCGVEAGYYILGKYGEALKSDFVEMAHHGQNGVDKPFYDAVSPSACLWDTPLWLWNNDAGNGYNTHKWKTVTVQGWMKELGVKKHFITKDGTNSIELPYKFD